MMPVLLINIAIFIYSINAMRQIRRMMIKNFINVPSL